LKLSPADEIRPTRANKLPCVQIEVADAVKRHAKPFLASLAPRIRCLIIAPASRIINLAVENIAKNALSDSEALHALLYTYIIIVKASLIASLLLTTAREGIRSIARVLRRHGHRQLSDPPGVIVVLCPREAVIHQVQMTRIITTIHSHE